MAGGGVDVFERDGANEWREAFDRIKAEVMARSTLGW
jgi:hypothetical protein